MNAYTDFIRFAIASKRDQLSRMTEAAEIRQTELDIAGLLKHLRAA